MEGKNLNSFDQSERDDLKTTLDEGLENQDTVKKTERLEKKEKWEKELSKMDEVVDEQNLGVDEEVKETVVAFNVHGFETSGSCEGHLGEEELGHLYPWIHLSTPEPEGLMDAEEELSEKLETEWRLLNLKQKAKLISYLEEFYKNRETPLDARLSFRDIGAFGEFRVQSLGADVMEILSPEEQTQKRELYLKEMKDFTLFLKDKYLEE